MRLTVAKMQFSRVNKFFVKDINPLDLGDVPITSQKSFGRRPGDRNMVLYKNLTEGRNDRNMSS